MRRDPISHERPHQSPRDRYAQAFPTLKSSSQICPNLASFGSGMWNLDLCGGNITISSFCVHSTLNLPKSLQLLWKVLDFAAFRYVSGGKIS